MPTQPGRPTIPPYIPIMPTLPGRPTRPPYIPIMPSKRPIRPFPYGRRMGRSLKERRGTKCITAATQPPRSAPTTLASRGTCPPQIYPCTLPANHTTQRDCESDHQCPDDHGCCYDHCLQEYKCRRLLPHTSTTTPAPRLSHRHENETRVKRSLQKDEEPAVVPETLAASETQASRHTPTFTVMQAGSAPFKMLITYH
ncbi:hypothetical protein O3P69_007453 [Scylla paramamosain]|uniref:WAP domain-containing protein n=1 Tax=Scylla paramamosain TaxID=85552 RepID=A0AAW0V674_SCYPA